MHAYMHACMGMSLWQDLLLRNIRLLRNVHGDAFDFVPTSFTLPSEYIKFVKLYSEEEEKARWTLCACARSRAVRVECIFTGRQSWPFLIGNHKRVCRFVRTPTQPGLRELV